MEGKKLPLISYTFKDRINVHFVDWEGDIKSLDIQSWGISQCLLGDGIHLPEENHQHFVELLQKDSDVFFSQKGEKLGQCHLTQVRINTGEMLDQ